MSNPAKFSLITNEILKASQNQEYFLNTPRGLKYIEGITFQKKNELKYLSKFKACPPKLDESKVVERLSGLNTDKLKSDLGEDFYNSEVMAAASCIANSLTLDQGQLALSGNERLREYISDLTQIGAESVSGYALKGSLGSTRDMFIVKAPRNPKDKDELVHEVMVALYGTNKLRSKIPNFAYVYGMFDCTSPYIEANGKKIVSWCNSATKGAVAYAIYENIAPAQSFSDFAKTCSPQDYLKYYLQTMLAIRTASEEIGFTHYDAHGENVLLRKIEGGESLFIPYETYNGTEYIETNGIVATFIDYGMSHIQLKNQRGNIEHFGFAGGPLTQYGVYRDRANPLHDAYKLLLMTLRDMYGDGVTMTNPECFRVVSPLLIFFNEIESPAEIVTKQNSTYYYLPIEFQDQGNTLDDWIKFIREYMRLTNMKDPIHSSVPMGYKTLSCNHGCKTFEQEMKEVGISNQEIVVPITFLELFDVVGTISNKKLAFSKRGNKKEADKHNRIGVSIVNKFVKNIDLAIEDAQRKLETLQINLASVPIRTLPHDFLNLRALNNLKVSSTKAAKFVDSLQRIKNIFKSMQYTRQLYKFENDDVFIVLLNKYEKTINDAKMRILKIKRVVEVNLATIKRRQKEIRDEFLWYTNSFPTLVNMVQSVA